MALSRTLVPKRLTPAVHHQPRRRPPGKGDGFPIMALVCSAGGLDTLIRVLARLPQDLPAAVIAMQHLPPEAPTLLSRRSVAGEFGADGVVGDRPAAVVADHVDLEWLAAGVPAGEERGVHRPLVAPVGQGEGDR